MERYAAIIRAENGWKVLLTDMEAQPHFAEVKSWGISFHRRLRVDLIPLDDVGASFYNKKNFVQLIDPNEPHLSDREILILCFDKAKKLGWVKEAQ